MTSDENYVIAFISATPSAIGPATDAVKDGFAEATVWNLLDDRLLPDAVAAGGLTPALASRMKRHITQAVDAGADGILLTCSMYGAVAPQVDAAVPVLAADEAAFADAISGGFQRILVVASLASALTDSVERLAVTIAEAGQHIEVRGIAAPEAFDAANSGDRAALVAALVEACRSEVAPDDCVLLAQYSLAPAQEELAAALGVPVISGPHSAIASLRASIVARQASAPTGVLGAIADDYTGGTDLALTFQQAGLRTLLFFGVPTGQLDLPPHEAIVVALKSRTAPVDEAVSNSVAAWSWLSRHGAEQLYFKYCSTFDSTPQGNIGPVLDALSEATDAATVITTPSSPQHHRTVYYGQLFVRGELLSQSPMAHHPLTPMTDSYLPRVLRAQTSRRVTPLSLDTIRQGAGAVRAVMASPSERTETAAASGVLATGAAEAGPGTTATSHPSTDYLLADGVDDADLAILARAVADQPLSAGAAGLASAIAELRAANRPTHVSHDAADAETDPVDAARSAILSGSCSQRTLEQIAHFQQRGYPSHRVDPMAAPDAVALAERALEWVDALPTEATPLLYTSLPPEELRQVQVALGPDAAATLLEEALSLIAQGLVRRGVRRIVCAGGETSGAIVHALGVEGAAVGEAVAPGVPWIHSLGNQRLALLLKSGNFGDRELFCRAIDPGSRWGAERSVSA